MQPPEVIELLRSLKLHGMVSTFDEIVTPGVKQQQSIVEIIGGFCQAEAAERKVRSIRYQLGIARFPIAKDLDKFQFTESSVNDHWLEIYTMDIFLSKPET